MGNPILMTIIKPLLSRTTYSLMVDKNKASARRGDQHKISPSESAHSSLSKVFALFSVTRYWMAVWPAVCDDALFTKGHCGIPKNTYLSNIKKAINIRDYCKCIYIKHKLQRRIDEKMQLLQRLALLQKGKTNVTSQSRIFTFNARFTLACSPRSMAMLVIARGTRNRMRGQ